MQFDPTSHELVPKHELLTPEEKEAFLRCLDKKIPCIKVTDRIVRHYDGRCGQIFRIYRKSELYYRLVVA